MNFSNMALFVVYPRLRRPLDSKTGTVSVFASLMGSMAAFEEKEADDFENLSLRNKDDTDDDDKSLEGVFFTTKMTKTTLMMMMMMMMITIRQHHQHHSRQERSSDLCTTGSLIIQAFGGQITLRHMFAKSTRLILTDERV